MIKLIVISNEIRNSSLRPTNAQFNFNQALARKLYRKRENKIKKNTVGNKSRLQIKQAETETSRMLILREPSRTDEESNYNLIFPLIENFLSDGIPPRTLFAFPPLSQTGINYTFAHFFYSFSTFNFLSGYFSL